MPGDYTKKTCTECGLVIHKESDEEKIRSLSGSSEYYHEECLAVYEARVKAEKKKRAKGGRPVSITPEVLTKLEYAFSCNANNTEACLFADISTKTLDRYKDKNPEFSLRIDELRSSHRLTAKINIGKNLKVGDIHTSQWVLNHTDPDYKPKSSTDVNVGAQKSLIDAIIEAKKKGSKDADDAENS